MIHASRNPILFSSWSAVFEQQHVEVIGCVEQVLGIFPTTIRRRILRHLYLGHVKNAYLFKGVRQKFLDALLSVARIELFMPQVTIMLLTIGISFLLVSMLHGHLHL